MQISRLIYSCGTDPVRKRGERAGTVIPQLIVRVKYLIAYCYVHGSDSDP